MNILVAMHSGKVRDTFFTQRVKKRLAALGNVRYNPMERPYTSEELRDNLEDIDILLTGWQTKKIDGFVLEKANRLKIVAHTGGSVAILATEELYQAGVLVLSGNIIFAESVAESCLCYAMAAFRRLEENMGRMRQGLWKDPGYYNEGIMDKTVGLVGFGMIAKFFARMLAPFHVKLKIYSGYLSAEEAAQYGASVCGLDEIFETCDLISIHSALKPETYHMIGRRQLSKIKDGALLLNTARGAVIDEAELIKELESGRFMAALDVFEEEPLKVESPLRHMGNVLLMPHQGGPTIDRREYVALAILDDLEQFIDGGETFQCEITNQYARVMSRDAGYHKKL